MKRVKNVLGRSREGEGGEREREIGGGGGGGGRKERRVFGDRDVQRERGQWKYLFLIQ